MSRRHAASRSPRVQDLRRYQEKRDFKRTPEPPGRVRARDGFSFVVQKHHARRLHYDFRLELGGVLKSWAVPKGPSLDPTVKRLAAHVEDHPVEYAGFEGVIPEGEYGGGKVIVWDQGRWIPAGDPFDGYRKGRLKFRLEGVKLHGGWNLIRMHGRPGEEDKNWLLIKERDEHAGTSDITQDRPESVLAETGPPRVWPSNRGGDGVRRARAKTARARKSAMPDVAEPELATLVETPPEGDEWLHEIKFDGYRVICRIQGADVRLTTRHGKDWTASFPTLVRAARELPVREAVLDGEIVVLDPRGVSSFQALQDALGAGREKEIIYYAFDLLYLDGRDLRPLPLAQRKEALAGILQKAPATIRFTDHVEGKGKIFFDRACDFVLEGIVSKRRDAPYHSGRTRDWLKTKCLNRQEFVVAGYTRPKGTRAGFGSLVLGVHDKEGRLAYVGRVGTGFSDETLDDLRARLRKLEEDRSPFEKPPAEARRWGIHWVRPKLVAEVAFSGWTDDHILRHPRYEGLREDKPAAEVTLERAERPASGSPSEVAGVKLTHPDRVLYPDQGITKRQLAEFYESISDWVLPHLIGRPLTIVRCPEGHDKECFYQKHAIPSTPQVVRRVRIREGTGTVEGVGTYIYIDGLPGLISLVQSGVLELHPWGSRVETLERPDRMTFDLDPAPEVPWRDVVETATVLRARLEELGLTSFVKTTGGKGLHVVVPLQARHSWEDIKGFSRAVAEEFVRAAPDRFVATMTKSKRTGKIFLDFFRNTRGATAVAAYSTRARAGAPVSTPLGWDELPRIERPDVFTVRTLPGRMARLRSDPWKGFFEARQSITAAMRRAVGMK